MNNTYFADNDNKYYKSLIMKGTKIGLCTFDAKDATFFVSWFNDPEIREWLGRSIPVNIDQEIDYIKSFYQPTGPMVFGILPFGAVKPVGMAGLYDIRIDRRSAIFGIFISSYENRRKGYGEEATKLILQYGFEQLNLHRIVAVTRSNNTAFLNLGQKVGFSQEGTLYDFYFWKGKFHDGIQLSILERTWNNKFNKVSSSLGSNCV